jgi:hypothetical protein
MLTPKSSLNSRALLYSGTPPPAKKLKNLNYLDKRSSNITGKYHRALLYEVHTVNYADHRIADEVFNNLNITV